MADDMTTTIKVLGDFSQYDAELQRREHVQPVATLGTTGPTSSGFALAGPTVAGLFGGAAAAGAIGAGAGAAGLEGALGRLVSAILAAAGRIEGIRALPAGGGFNQEQFGARRAYADVRARMGVIEADVIEGERQEGLLGRYAGGRFAVRQPRGGAMSRGGALARQTYTGRAYDEPGYDEIFEGEVVGPRQIGGPGTGGAGGMTGSGGTTYQAGPAGPPGAGWGGGDGGGGGGGGLGAWPLPNPNWTRGIAINRPAQTNWRRVLLQGFFGLWEAHRAEQAIELGNLQSNLATSPEEAAQAQVGAIRQASGGIVGGTIGFFMDLFGRGPVAAEVALTEGIAATQAQRSARTARANLGFAGQVLQTSPIALGQFTRQRIGVEAQLFGATQQDTETVQHLTTQLGLKHTVIVAGAHPFRRGGINLSALGLGPHTEHDEFDLQGQPRIAAQDNLTAAQARISAAQLAAQTTQQDIDVQEQQFRLNVLSSYSVQTATAAANLPWADVVTRLRLHEGVVRAEGQAAISNAAFAIAASRIPAGPFGVTIPDPTALQALGGATALAGANLAAAQYETQTAAANANVDLQVSGIQQRGTSASLNAFLARDPLGAQLARIKTQADTDVANLGRPTPGGFDRLAREYYRRQQEQEETTLATRNYDFQLDTQLGTSRARGEALAQQLDQNPIGAESTMAASGAIAGIRGIFQQAGGTQKGMNLIQQELKNAVAQQKALEQSYIRGFRSEEVSQFFTPSPRDQVDISKVFQSIQKNVARLDNSVRSLLEDDED